LTRAQIVELTIFVLAIFVGFEVISKVPTMLHTPLMSGTNAIHGIVLIGAMLIAGSADSRLEQGLAFVAVVFATVNVVGGFLVTDRMLEMFKGRGAAARPRERTSGGGAGEPGGSPPTGRVPEST
jgi:NAD(P) transhydrogenase subunit alpha